ncbi:MULTISPECIES: DinB family protein [Rhizobium/Agrobacterium group]|uniref:DinB family protein n=1 Tax=Rhizobium/Agrobacterium group TaxID=227290 RepID=UPI0008DBEC85|nr:MULTISPECIES: DinB family protein [Rhizobium/Agrobacterium group]MCF1433767.1 damage-inducible protein DinB [Allorhizobium ampelinum]MCF1447667.1 damage-inducible protein DinB [Allorhizobium ampelinum]MCF1470557.1 damage-inducible protein DinB [Allorhizobium ampelinum]MCF1482634.1 damage-inducible protein DinB [Allorhizobium ampelinum]MUO91937.1 damage-inducible protein DinB [Agrobacterium vitis]
MPIDPCRIFRKMARNNTLANARLLGACAQLQPGEFEAPRTSFFPSIKATLNHILTVDWFYVDALEGGTLGPAAFDNEEPFETVDTLHKAQSAVDQRLLTLCDALTADALAQDVTVHRGTRLQIERCDDLLFHLFHHQTHHRGQVHAMLTGTSVKPPQLDEFITATDFRDRADDMQRLGWTEADLGH